MIALLAAILPSVSLLSRSFYLIEDIFKWPLRIIRDPGTKKIVKASSFKKLNFLRSFLQIVGPFI